ncbi:MAG: hypothetical protein AAB268_06230 [Elusimicrobiota bacterium]
MKRALIGALIAGFILALFSDRSTPACLLAGALATFLLLQLGTRSVVEKVGALLTAAAIAWLGGPAAPLHNQSLFSYFAGWTIAASALAVYLHPRSE